MKPLSAIHHTDFKYANSDADSDFDPEHNKRVIRETIKKNERFERERKRNFDNKMGERYQAFGIYIRSLDKGGNSSNIEKFFGKSYLAYLKGEKFMNELKRYAKKE